MVDSLTAPFQFGDTMSDDRKALVLLSGGQDSTTVLALAIHTHGIENVHTLTFEYHQRHYMECRAAWHVRRVLGWSDDERAEILRLPDGLFETTSPLLSGEPVAEYESDDDMPGGVEPTFVEGRNIVFLSIAGNRAAARGISLIYLGIGQEDSGGYPDCREGFLTRMEAALRAGLGREQLVLVAPLMHSTKKQTVQIATNLASMGSKVMEALGQSHTCYAGKVPPCGKCHACRLRARGFAEAQVDDPLLVRLGDTGDA